MIKPLNKPKKSAAILPRRQPADTRAVAKELRRLREEVEDLLDLIDGLAARERNFGKPTVTHEEVCKRYGIKP